MMIFAALLAGGIGTRMGLNKPKQFEMIGNKPILIYPIETFLNVESIDKIIVSSPKDYLEDTQRIIGKYVGRNERIHVIEGGEKRSDTIMNSIAFIEENYGCDDDSILVTHDVARIFVSEALIERSISELKDHDASSPVIPAVDVIFESKEDGKLTDIPLRENLVHSQTPQSFKIKKYLEIVDSLNDEEKDMLDEAMMAFFLRDGNISLFKGESVNFKITRPVDLDIAKVYLKNLEKS